MSETQNEKLFGAWRFKIFILNVSVWELVEFTVWSCLVGFFSEPGFCFVNNFLILFFTFRHL